MVTNCGVKETTQGWIECWWAGQGGTEACGCLIQRCPESTENSECLENRRVWESWRKRNASKSTWKKTRRKGFVRAPKRYRGVKAIGEVVLHKKSDGEGRKRSVRAMPEDQMGDRKRTGKEKNRGG
ncbi:hypothetical protein B0H16DRAFT_1467066 [Mycena metata]|uniref:Uncharacterized protein n=1 Tax=Mycena metata TaxID=1033252 RepID=A0AAD7MW84_9AGAR|nr:hypothetical protein B0H16DRAFT_1467066 [Mycena metata]